jgi:CRISP-associated protein Cas1
MNVCPSCKEPFQQKDKRQVYCSRVCAGHAGQAKLRSCGVDASHGGKAADARRVSLAKRRAAGELLGWAARRARDAPRTPLIGIDSPKVPAAPARVGGRLSAPADLRPVVVRPSDGRPGYTQFFANASGELESSRHWSAIAAPSRIVTLAGRIPSLSISDGCLVVRQGITPADLRPETMRYPRGVHSIQAVVLLGHGGNITVDAMRWLAVQRIGLFVLGVDGELVSVSTPPAAHAIALRRSQYAADGLMLAKAVLSRKLAGCMTARPKLAGTFARSMQDMRRTDSVDELRLIEARAAVLYWKGWAMRLRHYAGFPGHWIEFDGRSSGISGTPRHATHPINAILNYGYSMLAGQVERTAVTRGLDVAVGSLHADTDGRPSLVYDLIEPLRPVLDGQVLGWAAGVRWRRADFVVTTEGKVRLSAGLARVVTQKAWLDKWAVDGVVGWYAGVVRGRGGDG